MQVETHPEADGAQAMRPEGGSPQGEFSGLAGAPEAASPELEGVLLTVGLVGTALALLATGLGGLRVGLAVGLGAGLGAANLWVLGRVVRAFLGGRIGAWGLVALLKFGALFGGLWALLRADVPALPLVFGFAAVPLGIVLVQLRGAPLPRSGG